MLFALHGFLLFGASILAFIVSAFCGGGAGLLILPVLGFLLSTVQAPVALSIGTAISSLSRIVFFYRKIRWKIVAFFVPAAIPAVGLGAYLLSFLDPVFVQIAIGIFLVMNLPMLFKKKSTIDYPIKTSHFQLSIIGIFAGFISGLTGAVGLLFNRFYLNYGLAKEEIIATRAANEIILHLIKIFLYVGFGLMNEKVLIFGFFIGIAAVLATFLTKKMLKYVSEHWFRALGQGAMVLSGFFILISSSGEMFVKYQPGLEYVQMNKQKINTYLRFKEQLWTLEFKYKEGFELEKMIDFKDLPLEKQQEIYPKMLVYEDVVFEEVFGFNQHFYEAYFYKDGVLIKKIKF